MLQIQAKKEKVVAGRVRGFLAEARLRWVEEYFGERALSRILTTLPHSLAAEVTGAASSEWCSLDALLRLDLAIAEVCGRDEGRLFRDLGRYAAYTALSPRYRPLRSEDLHQFFHSAVIRDALFQENARGGYERLAPDRGLLSIFAAPGVSAAWCRSLAGYLEQVVASHGRGNATVIETACRSEGQAACTFDIAWQRRE